MQTPAEQLNAAQYLFLVELREPKTNALELKVQEAAAEAQSIETRIMSIAFESRKVTNRADHGLFRLYWPEYIAFQVRNEAYVAEDASERFEGRRLRVYTKSRYFESLYPGKSQADFTNDGIVHFEVVCAHHIVDVLAEGAPIVDLCA